MSENAFLDPQTASIAEDIIGSAIAGLCEQGTMIAATTSEGGDDVFRRSLELRQIIEDAALLTAALAVIARRRIGG